MSVNDFKTRSHIALTGRGDKLTAIADKLQQYNVSPTIGHLDELRVALDSWKMAHSKNGLDSWKLDRRNVVKGKNNPVEELDEAVMGQYREEARLALAKAARSLDTAFGTDMDRTYHTQLVDTFINTSATSAQPLKCFVWFRTGSHKLADNFWQVRLKQAGAVDAQGPTNGLTESQSTSNVNAWNNWLDTNHAKKGFAVVGRYTTAGAAPPKDRIIETSTLELHTVAHEMLHWATHETFADHTKTAIRDATLGKFIREGITEWLTRRGLNQWNQGGYTDMVPIWNEIMNSNAVSFNDLSEAYFRGKDVKDFCDEIANITKTNTTYQTAKTLAQQKALQNLNF